MQRVRWFYVSFSLLFLRGYKVWTSWIDGYYLMTNTTNSGTNLSFWVPDWALANPRYINNPDTMKWLGRVFCFILQIEGKAELPEIYTQDEKYVQELINKQHFYVSTNCINTMLYSVKNYVVLFRNYTFILIVDII